MNPSRRPNAVYRVEVYLEDGGLDSGAAGTDALKQLLTQLKEERPSSGLDQLRSDEPRSSIPWRERAISAEEVGLLLGLSPRTVLETVACREGFPVRLSMRPATWVAGEVLAWRDANRVGRQARPRQRRRRNG